jgi:GAF domain-containing protein
MSRDAEWYGEVAMGITIFTPAPLPPNEAARSEASSQSGLLSRVNDPHLLSITKEARRAFNSRWCGIALVVGEIQHVIASSDGLTGLYRRSTMFSSYVVYSPRNPFIVLDAIEDQRFAGNPFVDNGLIRFYAGTAIFDTAGYAVGALCVSDSTSRQTFGAEETIALRNFSDKVSKTIR